MTNVIGETDFQFSAPAGGADTLYYRAQEEGP